MLSSFCVFLCISNNPDLDGRVGSLEIIRGGALAVLKKGRDMIHAGCLLVSAPLYGNFKPNQQPYRTLVLAKDRSCRVDTESLHLIENAIQFYESSHVLRLPGELPEEMDKDFRYADYMLMEEAFKSCGIFLLPLIRRAWEVERKRPKN